MQPGAMIRRLFGPYEHWVAETYRKIYVDLDDLVAKTATWTPDAQRILEVGCGEGAMTERLTHAYPTAKITAIDITPKLGRLFRGPASNVTFSQESVESVASREPASFDLVILADVMHHVPPVARESLMNGIALAMTPNGALIFKDWVISSSPIHWLCDTSDRYLTGDNVAYFTMDGIRDLLAQTFGANSIRAVDTVRPWKNNVAVLVQ